MQILILRSADGTVVQENEILSRSNVVRANSKNGETINLH